MFEKFFDWTTRIAVGLIAKRRLWVAHLAVFLFLLSPFLGLAIFSYNTIEKGLTEHVLIERKANALLAATMLKERFDRLKDIGTSLATRVQFRKFVAEEKWDEAVRILDHVPEDFYFIERIFLADTSGILRADIPHLPDVVGRDFSFRDWYQGIRKEWKPYLSEIYTRAAEPSYDVAAFAIPVRNEKDEPAGILVMQIKVDVFFDWSREVEIGRGGYVYFADKNGHVAAHPGSASGEKIANFSSLEAVQKVLRGESGVMQFANPIENEEEVLAYAPVPGYGWGVLVDQPVEDAFESRDEALRLIFIIYAVTLFFVAILAYALVLILHKLGMTLQKEKAFLSSIGDGVVVIERDFTITLWNDAASKISGWSKDEVIGKPFREVLRFVRASDRSENITFIEEAMLFGKTRFMENHTVLIRKDGTEVSVGDSAAPIFGNGGKVIGAIIVFRDTSKERESQLLKSDFAYASHQLRTPVNRALWSIEAALSEKDQEKARKSMEDASVAVQNVEKLVEQLIVASEIDKKTVTTKKETIGLTSFFEKILELEMQNAERHGVRLEAKPISSVLGVESDPKLLQYLVLEIVSNAIMYSPKGKAVAIEAEKKNEGILIAVRDGGIGIPENQKTLVFTKFFRGANVPQDTVGAGLGLYIANEYAKLIGAKIWFESKESEGTTFYILLP